MNGTRDGCHDIKHGTLCSPIYIISHSFYSQFHMAKFTNMPSPLSSCYEGLFNLIFCYIPFTISLKFRIMESIWEHKIRGLNWGLRIPLKDYRISFCFQLKHFVLYIKCSHLTSYIKWDPYNFISYTSLCI